VVASPSSAVAADTGTSSACGAAGSVLGG
jgi:hypothetical protein